MFPIFPVQTPELMPPNPQHENEESADKDNGCDSCCKPRQRRSYGVQGANPRRAGLEMDALENKDEVQRCGSAVASAVEASKV